jgi:putative nucleotidyltransferase with HDIG domain
VVSRDVEGDELAVIADAAIKGRGLLPVSLVRSVFDHDAGLLRLAARRDHAAIESLAVAVEAKDTTTSRHLRAVSRMARDLATLVEPDLGASDDFHSGCLLHDVGKIGVPETILTKPGPLNEDEWLVMRAHPETGARVIEPLGLPGIVHDVVLHHHERWDGRGYPHGLAGGEIPLGARIFSVCDALDAMTSNRPYRAAMPEADALGRVRSEAGRQFDPSVVDTLSTGVAQGAVRPWQRRRARGSTATLPRS